jgi:hypothetical protein
MEEVGLFKILFNYDVFMTYLAQGLAYFFFMAYTAFLSIHLE